MPISEVTSADVLEILTPLWHRKPATAKRVRQRLRAVLEWAVAMEYRLDNPCDRIGPVLGPQKDVTEHMQALPHREAAAVIRTVRASAALPAARLALEFLVLTGSCEASGLGWVNTVLGNVKRALDGTYHAWGQKYAPRYLAEFSYRFNRRYQLADLIPRLAHVAVQTPPLPYRLLTVAGTYA